MQQKNANAKFVFALAGVILLIGIALTAVFLAGPRPEEATQPARETAEAQEAPENSARTETGVSPLLLIFIFLVVLVATTKIGRILANKRAGEISKSQAPNSK
jgi:hypothetical protein